MNKDIIDFSSSSESLISASNESILSFESEFSKKIFKDNICIQSTPVKNHILQDQINATQILEQINQSKATNLIDENVIDSVINLRAIEEKYLKLTNMIEVVYKEINDPLSDFICFTDSIDRFRYIMNHFTNRSPNRDSTRNLNEKDEMIATIENDQNKVSTFTQMLSVIITSFVSWMTEAGNNLEQCLENLNENYATKTNNEMIGNALTIYLEYFMNVLTNGSTFIEIKNSFSHNYQGTINRYSQVLCNKICELMENSIETHFRSHIFDGDNYVKLLENDNANLEKQLIAAQNIITSGILPESIIEALNETKDCSIREIAEIDERYLMDKENIQNQYEAKILQYEEMLEKKEKELNKKENLILTLKKDLKSTERKIEQLKCCNDEMLKDYDRNVEKYVIENTKLKQDLKRKNKCCKHCVMRTSLQMSNKCVGNSGKNILPFNSFNNDGDHERKLNTTFDNGEDIKDNSQEKMDLQNYINSLHQIINNQQIIIDSCNANIRLQNDVIQKQCAMWNDNSSKYYTPNSTLSQVSYVDSFVSLRKNAIECERKDILLKNIENNFVESKGKIQNPELSRVVIDNDEQLNKTGCIFQEIISDNYNKSASNLVEFKPLNNSQFMNFETSTPKRSRIPTLNRSLKYV